MNDTEEDRMKSYSSVSSSDLESRQTNLDKFIDLIQKEPNMRPDFLCQEFIPYLKKHIEWFSTLKPEIVREIIKRCRFLRIHPESVFIKQGDTGDSMFAILRGTVGVYVIFDPENERECLSKIEAAASRKKLNRADLGSEVAQKVDGACIGEVALVNANSMRTATCVANTVCDILVIDQALYSVSVKEFIEQEFQDKTQFVERNPLFRSWSMRQRNQLIICMSKLRLTYGEKLVRQGQDVDEIFFINKGDVEVHIDVRQYQKQFPQLHSEMTTLLPELIKRPQKDVKAPHMLRKERLAGNKPQTICLLGANETVGALEVILNLDSYIETVIAHGECELLTMKRSQFEKTFKKKFATLTLNNLKETLANKLCLYIYQSDPENVALLKYLNMKLMDAHVLQEVRRSKFVKTKVSHVPDDEVSRVIGDREVAAVLKRLHMNTDKGRELPPEDKSEIALAKMDRRLRLWSEAANLSSRKLAGLQSATILLASDRETY